MALSSSPLSDCDSILGCCNEKTGKMSSKLTVVVPIYNERPTLRRALAKLVMMLSGTQ